MDVRVRSEGLSESVGELSVEKRELVGDGWEDEQDVTATTGARAEETRSQALFAFAPERERLRQRGLPTTGETREPHDRQELGDIEDGARG